MKWFKHKHRWSPSGPWKPAYDVLARYNAERDRGIVHEPEHVAWMERVQRDYNESYLGHREGWQILNSSLSGKGHALERQALGGNDG